MARSLVLRNIPILNTKLRFAHNVYPRQKAFSWSGSFPLLLSYKEHVKPKTYFYRRSLCTQKQKSIEETKDNKEQKEPEVKESKTSEETSLTVQPEEAAKTTTVTTEENPEKEKYKQEEEARILSGEREKTWPPTSSFSLAFGILSAGCVFMVLYTYISSKYSKLEIMSDVIRWGGSASQLSALGKLRRLLLLEVLGIKVSKKISHTTIVQDLLTSYYTSDPKVKAEIVKLLCILSKYKITRDQMVNLEATEILRDGIQSQDLYKLYTLANLTKESLSARYVLSDDWMLKCLFANLKIAERRKDWKSIYVRRASLTILSHLLEHASPFELSSRWYDSILSIASSSIPIFDPIARKHLIKIRDRFQFLFNQKLPDDEAIKFKAIKIVDTVASNQEAVGALLAFAIGNVWGSFRVVRACAHYGVLSSEQAVWAKNAIRFNPFVTVGLFSYALILRKISELASDELDLKDDKEIRILSGLYLTPIVTYFFALKWGPYALGPSLARFPFREDCPPLYLKLWDLDLWRELEVFKFVRFRYLNDLYYWVYGWENDSEKQETTNEVLCRENKRF